MSIAILFGRSGQGAEIAGFELDATLREDHERSSRVTESAIEDGSIVQDHVVREPERVTVEGYVTDTPIVPLGIDTRTPQTLEAPENFRGRFAGTDNAFDVLDELHRRGELISINTRWRPYEDMVIERLQLPRRQDSDALRFTLTAVRVRRVKVRFTDVDFGDLDTEDEHLAGESDQGSQPTEEASVGEIESPLKLGLDALGELF